MNNNKRKIILGSIIGVLIGTLMSVSYAFFTYANTSGTNSSLVTGNIWMKYGETNTLTLQNAMPSDTYDSEKKFEFTIEGANTTEDKDIWYEIKIKQGDAPTGTPERTNRIPDRFIKYKLVKEENNVEKVVVDGDSWEGLDTGKIIYVDKIEKNKPTVNHKYTLYMWISNKLEIGTSSTANFTINDWNKAFASIKVDVTGDFTEKTTDEPYQTVNVMNTFPKVITNQKANIKEVYFNKMDESTMNTKYNAAPIKADLTYNNEGKVLAWLETNVTDSTKYTMYVASDGYTYLTTGNELFAGWSSTQKIIFNNIDTSRITTMFSMFVGCSNLTTLDLSSFDTNNVVNFNAMFQYCSNLVNLDLSSFDTSKSDGYGSNNMANMFGVCPSLTVIYVSSKWNATVQPDSMPIFSGNNNLVGTSPNGTTYAFDSSKVDKNMAVIATDTTPGYLTDISLKPKN